MKPGSSWMQRTDVVLVVTLLVTAVALYFARFVTVDFSIELAFPRFDASRTEYESYRQDFPTDDAQALVVVEASDLFEPSGLSRLRLLEEDLARIPGVVDTQGLTTIQRITSDGDAVRLEKLIPSMDLTAEDRAVRRALATTDPLYHHYLASPDGRATTIRVTLTRETASDEAHRTAFLRDARAVVAAHEQHAREAGVAQRIVLNGLPVIRSTFTEMIGKDLGLLFPLALAVITLILYASFRSLSDVIAALITILFAVLWTIGLFGVSGVPVQLLTQLTPIVVMIISISDTVHIVQHFHEELAAGATKMEAIDRSVADSALPCLLTELTIAAGFVSLVLNDMVMIQQFGMATAGGMLLTWLANVTVLPLALRWLPLGRRRAPRETAVGGAVGRLLTGIERAVVLHPRTVLLVAGLALVALGVAGSRVGKEYYSYDDLRPESSLARDLKFLDGVVGGTVPFAIHVRRRGTAEEGAMLEPEALRVLDEITRTLERDFADDVKNASSLSKFMAQAHAAFAGAEVAAEQRLPTSRRLAAQELLAIDDPRLLRDVVNADRSAAAIVSLVPDRGSSHETKVLARLRASLATITAGTPYDATVTGIYGIADGIYRSLVGGLLASLGGAAAVSVLVFFVVLRSVRLALVALVPNLAPLVVTLGAMALLGIDIKPTTVSIFSITLVIADDDTIQYLSRYRRRMLALKAAGDSSPEAKAALETLEGSGKSMVVTTLAVAVGFLALLPSQFLGLTNLGLLIALSLVSAVFADLFLTPILLMGLRGAHSAASTRSPRSGR